MGLIVQGIQPFQILKGAITCVRVNSWDSRYYYVTLMLKAQSGNLIIIKLLQHSSNLL